MKVTTLSVPVALLFASAAFASGFVPTSTHINVADVAASRLPASRIFASLNNDAYINPRSESVPQPAVMKAAILPFLASSTVAATTAFPITVLASTGDAITAAVIPSALWAYGHFLSILVIVGCLTAERIIVKADMTPSEEDTIVKLDLVYGLMAALLIISGFARATTYGKGGDYYIHETLFWVKMTVSGIWGGLSLFPSLTFYKRNFARKNSELEVPPLSDKLASRLHSIINAEISAILSIPVLATLMSRGVWYSPDLPYQLGLVASLAATGGSFYFYARQALDWKEE
mmetsp:Transcript_33855/g.74494  ORF Transcript_33855/g.74494 Transcript_33855/m.74494 type:complete len:289 (-) Transcript_33855:150-1016(-)